MRVALDGTPLSVSTGGIRRYTEELTRALAACFPENRYQLFSDRLVRPETWLARRWWMFGLSAELGRWCADLFHGTDFAVPYTRSRPSVMTVHDLSPWLDPAPASSRIRRRTPFLIRRIATMIVTPSQAIRAAVVDRFGVSAGKVVAIPHAADARFHPVEASSRGKPYLLYLGTLEARKNLEFLLDVWRGIRRSMNAELLLAGHRRPDFEAGDEPDVRFLGAVPDDSLPQLYSGALACVYPSLYEGFGLPVLEAMQCGTPVIASTDPAIRETAGDAALLLDPRDRRAWADALRNAAENPEWRSAMRERSLARAREFSWERTARLTNEVYEEAMRRHAR